MDIPLFYALGILLCMILSAFFSGSETALTGVSRARLHRMVMEGSTRAKTASNLRSNHKDEMIGSILIGNTIVNIAASALATTAAIQYWGDDSVLYVTFALSALIILFCEVLPKTYAINNAEKSALTIAYPMLIIIKLMRPFTFALEKTINGIAKIFGFNIKQNASLFSSTEVIRGTIELHHSEGNVVKDDRDMLGSILDLDDIEVGQIMIHRKQIQSLDLGLPVDEFIRQAISSSHSRIPLFQDNSDNIIGILHIKNLFKLINTFGNRITREMILKVCAKPWFIPETTTLKEQLYAFRERKQHFALVVDEYGALLGIVTLEDVIEEIVGEIDDETDKTSGLIIFPDEDGTYHLEGTTPIRDINRVLDWDLPDEEAATIAGLIIHEARIIPEKGAAFEFHGYRFTVEDRKANQITKIKVQKLSPVAEFDAEI